MKFYQAAFNVIKNELSFAFINDKEKNERKRKALTSGPVLKSTEILRV